MFLSDLYYNEIDTSDKYMIIKISTSDSTSLVRVIHLSFFMKPNYSFKPDFLLLN